jgi:hypothetical protein
MRKRVCAAKLSKALQMLVTQKRSWPLEWDVVGLAKTKAEAAKLLVTCAARRDHMLSQIANIKALGGKHVALLVNRCVTSHSALIGEFALGFRKQLKDGELSAHDIIELATLPLPDLLQECALSDLIWIKKDNGKKRPAFRYSEIAYRVQRLAMLALRAVGGLHPNQFALAGGVQAASAWMAGQLSSKRYITLTDFPSFFLTVNRDRLKEVLPLKGKILSGVLFDPLDQFVTSSNMKVLHHDCDLNTLISLVSFGGSSPQRGLPPGNAMASLGAEHMMRHVLDAVENMNTSVRLSTYSDNVAISASTAKDARVAEAALTSVVSTEFGADVAGVLHQRMVRYSPGASIYWLGRNFTLDGKKVRQRLNVEDVEFFAFKIETAIGALPLKPDQEAIKKVWQRVQGWAEAHKFDPYALEVAHGLLLLVQSKAGEG